MGIIDTAIAHVRDGGKLSLSDQAALLTQAQLERDPRARDQATLAAHLLNSVPDSWVPEGRAPHPGILVRRPPAFLDVQTHQGMTQLAPQWEPAVAAAGTAVMERPKGKQWVMPPVVPSDDYSQVARRIGLNGGAFLEIALQRFIVDHKWPVYPNDQVQAYLQQLADQETERKYPRVKTRYSSEEVGINIRWERMWENGPRIAVVWLPLRENDRRKAGSSDNIYPLAVPLHAIEKVDQLERELGRNAGLKFEVSHYEVKEPDPFLRVVAGRALYVIDVWNEPGWGC
jgi:hypothetical protein